MAAFVRGMLAATVGIRLIRSAEGGDTEEGPCVYPHSALLHSVLRRATQPEAHPSSMALRGAQSALRQRVGR